MTSSWGADFEPGKANCDGCGADPAAIATSEIGSYGANRFGLFDIHGNVWEWVEDCCHENYIRAPDDGSPQVSVGDCALRVMRGGAWNGHPGSIRSASRLWNTATARISGVGLRIARDLD